MSAGPRFDPADFSGDITLDHVVPASEATFAPLPGELNPELVAALGRRGVERLYSHQAEAYEAVRRGRNLVVVTPTASGKTLCYNLPILQRLLEHPEQRALYLYPTKALAQDQLAELGALASGLPLELRVDTYDGDTPPGRRTAIREGGHVVMTNPDMLHTGLLPHHTRWRRLFSSLEFVVIDELHTYRGLFGSQVANVIRRLKRICAFYGSNPTFICASATIRNPHELATKLLEADNIALVDRNGAAGRKAACLLQPAIGKPRPRRAPQLDARGAPHRRALDSRRRADHRLLPQPAAGRGDAQLSAPGPGASPRRASARARLPRRLPASAPARDRSRAAQRRDHRRGEHQRARARNRHRQPAVRGAGRLSGHHRLDVAAAGPRRTQVRVGRGVRCLELAARPVHRPPSRIFPQCRSRRGPDRSRQPAAARSAPASRAVRAALHGRRATGRSRRAGASEAFRRGRVGDTLRRPVVLEPAGFSRRGGAPSPDPGRQRRDHRHLAAAAAGDRRDGPVHRACPAARGGRLPPRGRAVPRRPS